MTLAELCEAAGTKKTSTQAVVDSLLADGDLRHVGKGKRGDPHKFFLEGKSNSAAMLFLKAAAETNRGIQTEWGGV